MIEIIITDDHPIMIDGIKTALSDEPNIKIIGEALNGKELLKLLEKIKPDIILLDIMMPELDGIEVLKIAKRQFDDIKIIVLSQFGERGLIKKCIELGASGYLLKDCGKHDLVNAIKSVFNGETWFEIHNKIKIQNTDKPKFSDREKEVLQLIFMEYDKKEIAKKLNISNSTVNTYHARLLQKAGVQNDIGLYKWAIENKIID
jgi:DNA-binding NarL/FixJ family response regulator